MNTDEWKITLELLKKQRSTASHFSKNSAIFGFTYSGVPSTSL